MALSRRAANEVQDSITPKLGVTIKLVLPYEELFTILNDNKNSRNKGCITRLQYRFSEVDL